jgi:hypothetical protein
VNFAGFVTDCRAQWSDFDDWKALAAAAHPRDRRLASLPAEVDGMATENKLMLLNLAVRHLARDEAYVEVGCWKGLSLAGAAVGNPRAAIYACDNFRRYGSSAEVLTRALRRYAAPGQVRFFEMEFREFLARAPWQPGKVGAYFYDGGHSFDDQFRALELMLPWLADDAVVVIDDTNDATVRAANRYFTAHVPALELVADVRTIADCQPTWWNGVQVYRYRAHAAPGVMRVGRASYLAHRAVWNSGLFVLNRILTVPLWWANRRYLRGPRDGVVGASPVPCDKSQSTV